MLGTDWDLPAASAAGTILVLLALSNGLRHTRPMRRFRTSCRPRQFPENWNATRVPLGREELWKRTVLAATVPFEIPGSELSWWVPCSLPPSCSSTSMVGRAVDELEAQVPLPGESRAGPDGGGGGFYHFRRLRQQRVETICDHFFVARHHLVGNDGDGAGHIPPGAHRWIWRPRCAAPVSSSILPTSWPVIPVSRRPTVS